ncbi:type IV pilus modification PilV family protein [Paraglaciecola hydrolytica]|uniref:Prepilin-type N-terminal cleavage/methylation domain-containing protein n=1 Tax=Paraglaciecola hydrolytica TaxID=1799789 RepID=A0A148KLJ4_9ALTE|nr:hypothetical protein [Paraglaciecola hydrolytica]KXI27186.1 hypothetical protein AX660_02030 [Paraglaciecola hydrolytica]
MPHTKGFSLVEVMVASLMIMLGVTGYVTLQSEFVLADSQLNLRNVALYLAQEKLDELSSVSEFSPKAYNDVDNNAGGLAASGKVDVVLGNNQQNQRSFNVNWNVEPAYFVDSDNDGLADVWLNSGHPLLTPALSKNVAQKEVGVTVDWLDYQGKTQSLTINGRLAPVLQSSSATVINEAASINQTAQVLFSSSPIPDVVETDLGANEVMQSVSPVVLQSGSNQEVEISLDKYSLLAGQKIKTSQSDFSTLACSCELVGLALGSTPTMEVILNDKLSVQVGRTVQKMTGAATPTSQPILCQQCCRDHHDSAQTIADEEYYRSENGLAHSHYQRQNNGSYSPAVLPGEPYDEVCRFKRINGDFVLYPDWQLLDILVLSPDYLLSASNQIAYSAYNKKLLNAVIMGSAMPAKPTGRDLAFSQGRFQFTARGLYLDRLKSADKTLIKSKISKGAVDWLSLLPFYDVNLTLLADWHSSQTSVASISNDAVAILLNPTNQYYLTYSRALLTTHQVGTASISASASGYNATMAGIKPISPFEVLSIKLDTSVSVK